MPHREKVNVYISSNGVSLRDTVVMMYKRMCDEAQLGTNAQASVKLSLTDFFRANGYTDTDRVVVTWVMYHLGLMKKLDKRDRYYSFEVYQVDLERVTNESVATAMEAYSAYKRQSKQRRRGQLEVDVPAAESESAAVPADLPLSPALAEQIASLMVALEEKDAALAVAHKRIADLEDLVAALRAAPKQSVEDQLAAAIKKLRKK